MRILKTVVLVLVVVAVPLSAADQPTKLDQVIDRIINREAQLVGSLRQYSPLVETYIQNMRPDKELGAVPAGDKYFLGRAELAKGVELRPLNDEKSGKMRHVFGGLTGFFSLGM